LLKSIQTGAKANRTIGIAPSNDELNLYRVKDVINSMNQIEDRDVYNRASKFIDKKIEDLKESFSFEFTVEEFLKRLLVSEHPDIFENRETSMDFVGDNIVPREMQEYGSRQRGDAGRDSSGPRGYDRGGGRGGGYSRGGGRGFGGARGGFGGGERRSWNDDRGGEARSFDRGARSENSERSERSERPERRPWGLNDRGDARTGPERKSWSDDRGPRSENTERSERAPRGRTDGARSEGARSEGRFDKSSDKKAGPRGLRSRSATGSGFKSWNSDDSGSDRPRQRKSFKDAR